jgi:hypothetical protein
MILNTGELYNKEDKEELKQKPKVYKNPIGFTLRGGA